MYSASSHSKCRWVCFFMGTDLEKFSSTSLTHQWTLCSEWVPSECLSHHNLSTYWVRSVFAVQISLLIQTRLLFHWRKQYYGLWTRILAGKQQFKVKNISITDVTLFTSYDINWWTGVVWIIVMFLSAAWTLILTAPIHCSDVMPNLNSLSANFSFWVHYFI